MSATLLLLAHQGGWDEILFVLVPIALFVTLLQIANRRASRQAAAEDHSEQPRPVQPDDTE